MRQKGFAPIAILLMIAIAATISYFFYQKSVPREVVITGIEHTSPSPTVSTKTKSPFDMQTEEWMEYFNTKVLPEHINFQKEVKVTRVYPLKAITEYIGAPYKTWVIEVKGGSYYLVTPEIQKELSGVSPSNLANLGMYCNIDDVITVGTGLNNDLQDQRGYAILTGDCPGPSNGFKKVVSVYKLSTGEQIKLQLSQGISDSNGNAGGRLRGVFGNLNPILVVENGNFKSDVNSKDELINTAFFDVQTGQLKQLIKFK